MTLQVLDREIVDQPSLAARVSAPLVRYCNIHPDLITSIPQPGSKSIDEEILHLLRRLLSPTVLGWELPVVDTPPPRPDPRTPTLSLEFAPAIPVPPAKHGQVPQHTLRERQDHLIADRYECHSPMAVRVFDAREVGLFEAEVGYRWKGTRAWSRTNDVAGQGGCVVVTCQRA